MNIRTISLFFLSTIFLTTLLKAQNISLESKYSTRTHKPVIDTGVFNHWPMIGTGFTLTDNGKFLYYTIHDKPVLTTIVQDIEGQWKKKLIGVNSPTFSFDGSKLIYIKSDNSLCILPLGNEELQIASSVQSFQIKKMDSCELLIYYKGGNKKSLTVRNMTTGREKSFDNVVGYLIDENQQKLLAKRNSVSTSGLESLDLYDLVEYKKSPIWESKESKCDGFIFDDLGAKVAFIVRDNKGFKGIFCYDINRRTVERIADDTTLDLGKDLVIDNFRNEGFSADGKRLLIKLKNKKEFKLKPGIDIWSHKDIKLQSSQLVYLDPNNRFGLNYFQFIAIVFIDEKRVVRLNNEDDNQVIIRDRFEDLILLQSIKGDMSESKWNEAALDTFSLISASDNARKKLPDIKEAPSFSPGGAFLIGYLSNGNIFCLGLKTKISQNITASLPIPRYDEEYDYPGSFKQKRWLKVAGWLQGDSGVLVYDRYDIWLIDPLGDKAPISLTRGYGRQQGLIFRFAIEFQNGIVSLNDEIILSVFDTNEKKNGFYSLKFKDEPLLKFLSMGNFQYSNPMKAANSNTYLVLRESASQSPNLFRTSNFVSFYPISYNYPESEYNWIISELHTWKSPNGSLIKGILYKPENFNPKNKYPLIFNYYEKVTNKLNEYSKPGYCIDNINIPYLVSNGYLVFTPDIHYSIGKTGRSALNSIVSAQKYLSKYDWIDLNRIGLQGHSFGAYETNYVISHTNIFAAAMSSSGISNFTSDYNSIGRFGEVFHYKFERSQYRIGATLWENPKLYIDNSPIFRADRIVTPLLMMNNKKDLAVPFAQGVDFFVSLRRLKKLVWMLQYDEGSHTLGGYDRSAFQHTIRVNQFFDHYLKHAPAPIWMTQGIPARLKQVITGYDLDPTGNCGKDCKVCKTWNERWTKDSAATKQLIEKEEKNQWMGLLDTVKPNKNKQ